RALVPEGQESRATLLRCQVDEPKFADEVVVCRRDYAGRELVHGAGLDNASETSHATRVEGIDNCAREGSKATAETGPERDSQNPAPRALAAWDGLDGDRGASGRLSRESAGRHGHK